MLVGQGQLVTRWRHNEDTEDYICVWGYDVEALGATPDTAGAHQAYDIFVGLLSFMSDECHLVGVDMQEAVVGGTLEATWNEVQDGANDFAAAASNCAYLVTKFTDGFGTGRSGRCYLPGVLETKVNPAGGLDGTWQDSVSDQLAAQLASFPVDFGAPLVVNRGLRVDPTDPPPRVPSVTPDPLFWTITSMQCESTIGTQRRRVRR